KEYQHSVATVWDLSFEKARDRDELAPVILGACAFLQPDAIPVSLFKRQVAVLGIKADADAIEKAVSVLVEFSLVRRTTGVSSTAAIAGDRDLIAIHRLIQAAIRDSSAMTECGGQQAWCERLVAAIDKEVTSSNFYEQSVRKINDAYIPHIHHVVGGFDWRE